MRDLEARLQRLRIADRLSTRSLVLELAGTPARRAPPAATRRKERRPTRDSRAWGAVRAIWQRLVR
ncbi:MAG TPA: hypothetical protein VFP65_25290 [Anaeromyxobacteraceae bacterium]|nr:hypothetical protein [Anaeromyxobacteraceae bacterium]